MNKLRIAFVVDRISNVGGIQQVVKNITCELSNIYDIHIVSLYDQCPENLKQSNILYSSICPESKRIRKIVFKLRKGLRKYLKDNAIDIAVLSGHQCSFWSMLALPLRNIKFIACDHGAICNQLDNRTAVFMRKWTARFCHHIVTLTEQNRQDYLSCFHVRESKVSCIPNWIPSYYFDNLDSYNAESRKIISVTRLSEEKGIDHLLDVAKKVLSRHPDWGWDIYGDGELRVLTQNSIEDNGLENRLVLKGEVGGISEIYQDYAMLVLSSYREGLPLTLLEAKAKKLPLISFDVNTGPREIITENVNGYLVEPYNVNEMADKICTLIDNPLLRQSFSDNAHLNIEKFKHDRIITQWRQLFELMTENK